ncbi:hypothetical protein Q5P01_011779 [Channa striata]|uniref:Uncharacterized protein n=1 Tax=Channa striata TaxID=64152 RepID=A0AA88MXK9_CHASR|nr:hypothetical protein Q5P01_011779 [Channa striata]
MLWDNETRTPKAKTRGLVSVGEQGPHCALFSTFLRPYISPAAGRTPLCHVQEGAPDLGGLAARSDSRGPSNEAIKGKLYTPRVVLLYQLDKDTQRSLRWINSGPYGNLGHMLNFQIDATGMSCGAPLFDATGTTL